MGIFGNIMSKIFGASTGSANAAPAGTANTSPVRATSAAPAGAAAEAAAPAAAPIAEVDVVVVLTDLAAQNDQKLDWRRSIVDLMKLLDLDSSLTARKQLAKELNYTGNMNDSATMNIWLHKQVMQKLAENGGRVPEELKS